MTFIPVRRVGLALVAVISLCSASIATSQSLAPRADRVAWVLFVDDLHLDFRNTGRVRDLVKTLLNDLVLEGDPVAIRSSGPSPVLTEFSSRKELLPFARKLAGNALKPAEIATGGNQLADEQRYRVRVTLLSAAAAVALLGKAEPHRRALLYISNGHAFDMNASIEARTLIRVAAANGVKIFAIDGASLDRASTAVAGNDPAWDAHKTAARRSLRVIAEQSGGTAILDAPDAAALRQVRSALGR